MRPQSRLKKWANYPKFHGIYGNWDILPVCLHRDFL